MGLDWGIYDLDGVLLGTAGQRKVGSRVDVELNGHRRGMLRLDLDDPLTEHVEPLRTVSRAWLDGALVLSGVVGKPSFRSPDGYVDVPINAPSRRLEHLFVGQRTDGLGFTGHPVDAPYRLDQMPEGTIMWRLVEHGEPSVYEMNTLGIPGHGIVQGNITPGVLRDREYEPGKQLWEAMVQHSEVIGGQDFDLRPILDPARPWALVALDTSARMGADLTGEIVLEHAVGANTASALIYEPSDEIVNRMTGVGEAPDYAGTGAAPVPPTYMGHQNASQIVYGIYGDYQAFSSVSEVGTLAEHVGGVLSTEAFPVYHFEVTPALQDNTGFVLDAQGAAVRVPGFGVPPRFGPNGQWWLGDSFRTIGQLGRHRTADLYGRVIAASMEEADEAGNVRVTVKSAPRVISVVSS